MNAILRLALAFLIAVLGVFALRDVLRLGNAAPWRQTYDFADFYCAGAALDAHRDPYLYEPLRTCEHRANRAGIFGNDPALAIPAPQPPFDFPPFMALARLDFPTAKVLFAYAVIVAIALSMLALWRSGAPLDLAVLALLLPAGYVELNAGQVVAFALLFLTLCGAALAARRDALAGFCAAMTAVEPHIALPVALAMLLFVPRGRRTLLLTLVTLGIIGGLVVGPATALGYLVGVLPGQAFAEIHFPYQYSLTYALATLGAPPALAQAAGIASFVTLLLAGLWIAPRLAHALRARALLAYVPAATAVVAGAYVHAVELCIAVPAALLMAVSLRGAMRNLSAAALCALAIPWILLWPIKKLFALSVLLCVLILVRLQINVFFAAGTLLAFAAYAYAFERHPPALADAFRSAGGFRPDAIVQVEWRAFVESLKTRDPLWLGIKLPTWAALTTLLAVAVARVRDGFHESSLSISRRI